MTTEPIDPLSKAQAALDAMRVGHETYLANEAYFAQIFGHRISAALSDHNSNGEPRSSNETPAEREREVLNVVYDVLRNSSTSKRP